MTFDERVESLRAVAPMLTDRQARFLVTVMLHAGVCLGRHYCTFAGIAYGRKMHDFYSGLLEAGFATVRPCRHNTAKLYHVHHKPLYAAIGEPDNRHRKPVPLPRAVERLMLLDGVLADRDRIWLATERDKVEHFTLEHRVRREDLPRITFRGEDSETVRYFPDKAPIGVSADAQRHTFAYLVDRSAPIEFRAFLESHAELLRGLRSWTVRLLVPPHFKRAVTAYHAAFREQLAMPLRPVVLDELRWLFNARRQVDTDAEQRFQEASRAFRAPRFSALYRAWQERGEAVLDATASPVLADAITRGTGALESYVLPYRYLDLTRLVGTA